MKVIVVNGFGGCGKTSFEEFFSEYAEVYNKKVFITSMVEDVKILASFLGWDGGKTDKDRRFLADLKDALDRFSNYCMNHVIESIEFAKENNFDYIIIDAREPEDIDFLKKNFKAISVFVDRNIERDYGNHADNNVRDYSYDYIINNNKDLSTLKITSKTFLELLEFDKVNEI